eukprot:gene45384-55527_t
MKGRLTDFKNSDAGDYFDNDDDGDERGGLSHEAMGPKHAEEDVLDDPLDAFMAGIQAQAKRDREAVGQNQTRLEVLSYADHSDEDLEPAIVRGLDSDAEAETSDEDGLEKAAQKRKVAVAPLPALDFSQLSFPAEKGDILADCLANPEGLATLPAQEVQMRRRQMGIEVFPAEQQQLDATAPLSAWRELALPPSLLRHLADRGCAAPTAVQAQAIPL